MKYLFFFQALLACCLCPLNAAGENAGTAKLFTWGLYWGGAWEESKTLANRGEFRLGWTPPGLFLRGQALDKRPFDFHSSPPWADEKSKAISGLAAGLYHKPTGSRVLYGVIDEWGLSARVRNPWIRGAPFAENHKPLMADLKTAVSSTKEPETYLYLSSPWLALANTAWRGFASMQTRTNEFAPDWTGGIEAMFNKKTRLLLEGFYTEKSLPPRKSGSWFADPAPLPERDFRLSCLGLLFNAPYWSFSSDFAYSETFAWGRDIYGNLGILITPPLERNSKKPGPWSLSLAADGAGGRWTGRDGTSPGAGFRTAGKLEYKGKGSGLFRLNTTLRGPGLGEKFNRSSSGIYYRFPAPDKKKGANTRTFPLRVSRISLTADRNAVKPEKIVDGISGTLGLSLSLFPNYIKNPLGINISGGVQGVCSSNETPSPYPLPQYPYRFDSAKASGELSWSPGPFQFKTKWGYKASAKKEGQWDSSFSAAFKFKPGRFSVKVASPNFPDDWNCTLSWHIEKK